MFKNVFRSYWPVFFLFLIVVTIVLTNPLSGGWLTGWDNLHSEFSSGVNLKRAFFAVWQEYQGVGLLGGMGHAADLFRQLFLLPFSLLLPDNWIRYGFHVSMLLLGAIGVFLFIKEKWLSSRVGTTSDQAALLGALFYLLNLGTVLYLYVPFEPYSMFFGMFPWQVLAFVHFLQKPTRKRLLALFLVSVCSVAQAYVQTLFVVLMLCLGLFALNQIIVSRTKALVVNTSLGMLTVFIVNAFWLLPAGYFVVHNFDVHRNAAQIKEATGKFFLMNKGQGKISDFVFLKEFYYDFTDYTNETDQFGFLAPAWREWFETTSVAIIGVILFLLVILGFTGKNQYKVALLGIFLLTGLAFLSDAPFVAQLNEIVRQNAFFDQLFRNPYTKLIVPAVFAWAVLFSGGVIQLVALLNKLSRKSWLIKAVFVAISLSLIYLCWPAWKGHFFYQSMRLNIPQAYFHLFDFFKTQPSQTRIAHLPMQTMWGWNYYSWGYRGSGFLWYGIEQPILDRAFDVWSGENETFYLEFSTALYSCPSLSDYSSNEAQNHEVRSMNQAIEECSVGVERVLDKYDVTYVLLDGSIVAPGRDGDILRRKEIEAVLQWLGWREVFDEPIVGDDQSGTNVPMLEVWEKLGDQGIGVDSRLHGNDRAEFVWAPERYSAVEADTSKTRKDVVYATLGNYIEFQSASAALDASLLPQHDMFPFADVYQEELADTTIHDSGFGETKVEIERSLASEQTSTLVLPSLGSGMNMPVIVTVQREGQELRVGLEPGFSMRVDGQERPLPSLGQVTYGLSEPMNTFLLQVGQETWDITQEKEQKKVIQMVVGEPIIVRIYGPLGVPVQISDEISPQQITQCWTREGKQGQVDVVQQEDFTTMRVADASGCVSYPLGVIEADSLLRVSVAHRSADGARPHFCVDKVDGLYACEHEAVFTNESSSRDWTTVERFVRAETGAEHYLDLAARPPDQEGESWAIDYRNPRVERHALLSESILESQLWQPWSVHQNVSIPSNSQQVNLSFSSNPVVLSQLFGSNMSNCDVFKRGFVQAQRTAEGMRYQASDRGAMCDVASNDTVSLNESYVLHVVGQNLSGRSLKFYLSNWASDRTDLEYLLDEGVFNQTFSVLDWQHLGGSGYSLNLETRSFGSETAENTLSKASLYPVPLSWLSGIKAVSGGAMNQEPEIENGLMVRKVEKRGTSHYRVEIEQEDAADRGLIALSQGFDRGWLGYQVGSAECGIVCQFAPWWFGEKLEHVKVNGWANGFLIEDQERSQITDGRLQVVIVFWPQYLEWGGLLLLVGAGMFLVFRVMKQKMVGD